MRQIRIGDEVIFEGVTYQVVGMLGDQAVLFNPDVCSNSSKLVPVSLLEMPAENIFDIGDEVRSHHWFRGEVVGFEPDTNRVVCRKWNCTDRVRYAYKIHELIKLG